MNEDIAAAEAVAREVGLVVLEVEVVYLVGSRAQGTATESSDFDMVAVVTGSLRPASPTWTEKGRAPAPGFATSCNGAPIHWELRSAEDFDPRWYERNAEFRGTRALRLYDRTATTRRQLTPWS